MYRIASEVELSPLRIGAGSIAVGLHALALGLMLMPSPPLQSSVVARPQDLVVDFVAEVVAKPEPVPPVPTPPRRQPQARSTPVAETVPVQLADSALPVPFVPAAPEFDAPGPVDAPPPPSRAAQIAYDHAAPPAYPSLARRRGWEGTVLLRVRVGADGRPTEVLIERSSGHGLLDRSASEHVLARWRFQPAVVEGRAVSAWARVPIVFDLRAG